jgi:hypothetical protein
METTFIYYIEKNGSPIYVGKSNKPKQRLNTDHYKNFGKDINQYIIDEVLRSEWRFWEQFYIDLFRSWGFVLLQQKKAGGGVCHHTEESIEKIKAANINTKKPKSKSTKKKMSVAKKGKQKNGDLSYLKDPKRAEKIKLSRIGKPHPKKSNPVIQYDLDNNLIKEWKSANDLLQYGYNPNRIRACCRGQQKTSNGFIWKYK